MLYLVLILFITTKKILGGRGKGPKTFRNDIDIQVLD